MERKRVKRSHAGHVPAADRGHVDDLPAEELDPVDIGQHAGGRHPVVVLNGEAVPAHLDGHVSETSPHHCTACLIPESVAGTDSCSSAVGADPWQDGVVPLKKASPSPFHRRRRDP
jgi:hypothetical protein